MPAKFIFAFLLLTAAGCAAVPGRISTTILRKDDIAAQQHEAIGILKVYREKFGQDPISGEDHDWAEKALMEQAYKIGADAITSPEISIQTEKFLFFPISKIEARSMAVRFR